MNMTTAITPTAIVPIAAITRRPRLGGRRPGIGPTGGCGCVSTAILGALTLVWSGSGSRAGSGASIASIGNSGVARSSMCRRSMLVANVSVRARCLPFGRSITAVCGPGGGDGLVSGGARSE